MKVYRNKKTGKLYVVTDDHVTNCTNANDGQIMVEYRPLMGQERTPGRIPKYVREFNEFHEKFELDTAGL